MTDQAKTKAATQEQNKKPMQVILAGDNRFKKIRQKLEFHLPQCGYNVTSIQFLANLEADGKEGEALKKFEAAELVVVVTNETGFVDDKTIKYIDAAIAAKKDITILGELENYTGIPITSIEDAVQGIFNLDANDNPVLETEEEETETEVEPEIEEPQEKDLTGESVKAAADDFFLNNGQEVTDPPDEEEPEIETV